MTTENAAIDPTLALTQVAVEMWKLLRAFERTFVDLPAEKLPNRVAQHRYSTSRLNALLDGVGIKLLTFDGEQFTAHLPVSPANADDIEDADSAVIESTIEPTIIGHNVVLHIGKVMLAGNKNVSRD